MRLNQLPNWLFSIVLVGMVFSETSLAQGSPSSLSQSLPAEAIEGGQPNQDQGLTVDSLPEALRAAWSTEARILEAQSVASASGYDVEAARTGFFPFATIGANQSEDGDTFTSLRIVQPLWNGGFTRAEVDGARQAERAAIAEIELARLEVGREVLEAYFELLSAETQEEQWSRHIETLERLVGVIQRRAEEGVAPEADVQTAVSRIRQAEAGREVSRAASATQRAELARLMSREAGEVHWPSLASQLSPDEQAGANDSRILERHPQLVAADALIAQQAAEERRQRAAVWPELQLQYRVDVEGVRTSQQDGALLVLEYQTGNGLRGIRAAQAESERTRAASQRRLQARQEVVTRLRVVRAELVAAVAQRRSQAAAVAATDVLLDSFLRQFEVGRKSWVEVLNASREANDTRLQAVAAESQYWLANATLALESLRWERLVGPVDDGPASPPLPILEPERHTHELLEQPGDLPRDEGMSQ